MIQRYVSKISGPLLDRIDIHIEVPAVKYKELRSPPSSEDSAAVRQRVIQARNRADGTIQGGQEDLLERPDDAENDSQILRDHVRRRETAGERDYPIGSIGASARSHFESRADNRRPGCGGKHRASASE